MGTSAPTFSMPTSVVVQRVPSSAPQSSAVAEHVGPQNCGPSLPAPALPSLHPSGFQVFFIYGQLWRCEWASDRTGQRGIQEVQGGPKQGPGGWRGFGGRGGLKRGPKGRKRRKESGGKGGEREEERRRERRTPPEGKQAPKTGVVSRLGRRQED